MDTTFRPYRSVLYIPGSKERALDKARGLACDAIIFDLEDAVTPEEKVSARETLREALRTPRMLAMGCVTAALISIISAAPSVAAAQVEDETTADVLEDVGDDLADATDSVIGEYLSIGPVIYVDQGARVTVMVDRDLEIF